MLHLAEKNIPRFRIGHQLQLHRRCDQRNRHASQSREISSYVVATRVDGQWLILDNRTLTLVRDTDVTRAIPEFVLDHEGVKRFNRASQNRRVGS